ncbi:protein-glutamine gamma-glutamyltransferase K-like [Conger conger]|uniref:protein-glutamine gamma-glutamyltransferase K-like n=1 Tax=Conger conger TaxID=82655 RepID=UPI002A598EA8|nr:protein-glutamine gamma-glutamyltransferase K-like [Conger conger]
MPAELVGRFPSARAGAGAGERAGPAEKEEVVESKAAEEKGGCRSWLLRACPCCCRAPSESADTEADVPQTDGIAAGVDADAGRGEPDGVKPPLPQIGDTELEEVLLQVRLVDLLKSHKGQNRTLHHTDQYHSDDLIIRRGETFQVAVDLSRPFNSATDKLHMELKTGPRPLVSKGTHIIIPLVEELTDDRWEAKIVEQDGNRIKLSINSTPTAPIGRYHFTVATAGPEGVATAAQGPSNDIIMLFNPWCEDDSVYLDDEEERQEYVLNDTGRLYYGTEKQIGARTWNYGQFSEGVLSACLYILEKSDVLPRGRGDPVNVVRAISAMINSPDDRGVLEGNWSGDYADGTAPTAWSGSVDILKKYHDEGGMPVKYGQCWVFSGVTTTVLRCLGVPARSVTNFQSAHDTDVSLTIDIYFDENMEALNSLNSDSVWNFHVWNDCWMARPDLPPGMGGWQAVDSTPQETSHGTFRCGPASITAVRNGQVYHKHDTPFVFAEVNSDKIYWQRNLDGTFSQIHSEKKAVGHFISTKAVGSNQRHDITHLYKHSEGSEEERIAVETASRYGTKPNLYSSAAAEDVHMEVTMEGEGPRIGGDAQLTIVLRNQSAVPRSTSLHSQVEVMYYTGVLKGTIKKDQLPIELAPNEVKTITWVLPYQNYQDQLVDQGALMLTLSGRVRETQQVLATQTCFRLRTPDISITPLGDAVVGKEMAAEISFTNPLPRPLKGVVFRVEGLGLQSIKEIPVGDVGSRSSVTLKERFVPSLAGVRKLVASMHCAQLTQVHGVVDITVQEN